MSSRGLLYSRLEQVNLSAEIYHTMLSKRDPDLVFI